MKYSIILSTQLILILFSFSVASPRTIGCKITENALNENAITTITNDIEGGRRNEKLNHAIGKSVSKIKVKIRRSQTKSPRYNSESFVQVSSKNHRYLQLGNGTPYIPVGPNICWPRFETNEEKVMAWMENDFRKLSKNGGNYTRIFLSAPFYELEYKNTSGYNFKNTNRIDRILNLASKYRIKIKFCFEHFRKLTNSPAIFPGSIPFDKPIYHVSNGGPLNTMDEYFSKIQGKELFLEKMAFYSNKYRNNPNVYGWELWNEINAVNAIDTLTYNWTNEMLDQGHKYFPKHMVMQSLGSFECEKDSFVYKKYSKIPKNDLAQVHRYLNSGSCLDICKGPMDILTADAVRQILSFNPGKPVILSETGAVEANHSGPSKLYDIDKDGILLHDLLFAPFFSGAAAPGSSWHWDFYIEKNNLWWHFGRFNQAIKGINPINEDFQPVFSEDSNLRMYILKGKKTLLFWCRDKASDWQTELIEGKRPQKLKNLKIDLSNMDIQTTASIEYYLPWENKWVKGKIEGEKANLPEFNRSVVIRIIKK